MLLNGFIVGVIMGGIDYFEFIAEHKKEKWIAKFLYFGVDIFIYIVMMLALIFSDYHDFKNTSAGIVLAFLVRDVINKFFKWKNKKK